MIGWGRAFLRELLAYLRRKPAARLRWEWCEAWDRWPPPKFSAEWWTYMNVRLQRQGTNLVRAFMGLEGPARHAAQELQRFDRALERLRRDLIAGPEWRFYQGGELRDSGGGFHGH